MHLFLKWYCVSGDGSGRCRALHRRVLLGHKIREMRRALPLALGFDDFGIRHRLLLTIRTRRHYGNDTKEVEIKGSQGCVFPKLELKFAGKQENASGQVRGGAKSYKANGSTVPHMVLQLNESSDLPIRSSQHLWGEKTLYLNMRFDGLGHELLFQPQCASSIVKKNVTAPLASQIWMFQCSLLAVVFFKA